MSTSPYGHARLMLDRGQGRLSTTYRSDERDEQEDPRMQRGLSAYVRQWKHCLSRRAVG
jgi:hypothetical protein